MSAAPSSTHTARSHWWIVFSTGLLTVICGIIGYLEIGLEKDPHGLSIWIILDALYVGIQLLVVHKNEFSSEHNAFLEIGRWLGAFTFLATAWFLLVHRLRHELRLLRLRFWKGHFVICGLSTKAMALIESIKHTDGRARIVVIDSDPAPELAQRCQELRVCLLQGHASDESTLQTARVRYAREVLAVGMEDETNIRVAAEVRSLRAQVGETPGAALFPGTVCRAHLALSHLPEALQKWTDARRDAHTTLRFFDVFDSEARRVLLNAAESGVSRSKTGGAAPLDGPGVGPHDTRNVHLVILGMGRMGTSLLVRAAKIGQLANGQKLRITVIDREAQRQQEQLFFRYPILAEPNEVCDVQGHEWQADSLETRQFIQQCARDTSAVLHLFICLDSNARSVELGLRLWEMVAHLPESYVHVRITSRSSVAPILKAAGARIESFGMLEDTCTAETVLNERIESLARSIHEDFVVVRRAAASSAAGAPARPEGDLALAPWERLREDFRESNRQQADHMGVKMRAIGCQIIPAAAPGNAVTAFVPAEVEMLAELEHRRWNAERWLSGWRWGEVTDPAKRIHSCLVAWQELPEEMKEYDREAVRKIPQWLAGMKPPMKVVRAAPGA